MHPGKTIFMAAVLISQGGLANVVNRWSFNQPVGSAPSGTTVIDSVSGAAATVHGVGAGFTGSSIILPGGSNGQLADTAIAAYIDLPNGLISSKTNLTVEIWATPISARNWQRLFDFGRTVQEGDGGGEWTGATAPGTTQMSDGIFLSLQRDGDINLQRMESATNGTFYTLNSSETTAPGRQYHYVMTYTSGAGTFPEGGLAAWYRDGVLIGSIDLPYALSAIEDVNNWLGRSQWSSDQNANVAYNEVRIYNNALSAAEVASNYQAGPELGLRYRWSFNESAGGVANGAVLPDFINGTPATVLEDDAAFNGSELELPGSNTSGNPAYLELPSGIISSLNDLTVELWATPESSAAWQRLFDFGSDAADGEGQDEFALTLNIDADYNAQRLYGRFDRDGPIGDFYAESSLPTTLGMQYHYVVTYEQGVGAYAPDGGTQKWYRDGVLAAQLDLPFLLSDFDDVNNWIARSHELFADAVAQVSLNELRIYSFAFSTNDVAESGAAGPDTLYTAGAPVANPDAIVMHPGGKARIYVLDNDTGSKDPATLRIEVDGAEGSAIADSDGSILYANANASAANDTFTYTVSGLGGESDPATVTVEFSDDLRIANPDLARPESPPSTFYQLTDALPGLTFAEPICLASPPGDPLRLFVCERMARIRVVPDVTAATLTNIVFLDMQQVVQGRSPIETVENWGSPGYYENGILGLAFHPDYENNDYFYVAYTVQINGGAHYQRISRFSVSSDPNVADPNSELILLEQLDEGFNHNGGDLHFGPDGYLYYAAGDEENPNDFRDNSQTLTKDFFAGIFRIDVDKKPGNLEPTPHAAIPTDSGVARFSVPLDNPFVHTSLGGDWDGSYNGISLTNDLDSVRMEYWATGLRHAWRMSFDPLTGDLWAGDVGQNTYEEVNRIDRGGNYGWVYREGAHDFGPGGTPPPGFSSIDPVYEYVHGNGQYQGNSICGGYVYRGTRFPEFQGRYIFCDSVSGNVWELNPANNAVTRITGVGGAYGYLVSMGVDPSNQDILFADYINGRILRLATGEAAGSFPLTLSETRLFADLSDLTPSPGLLPYDINLPFWSDYAFKTRWFGIPDATNAITWARDANWTIPDGILWVKHFDLELERGNPASRRRIETRVLTKTAGDYYGVSYQWNDAGTEAYLVPDSGADFDLDVVDGGVTNVQHWSIPSRSSCLTCHTPQAGRTLGFTTRQLNMLSDMNGFIGNQLDLLHQGGYFANTPDPVNTLPRHLRPDESSYPLEERVRSYLAVNCAYCHRADGTVSGSNWDGRSELTLAQTGLINGEAVNNGGDSANRYVVPGDTLHSIIYNRAAATNGFTRMPPLATSELDHEGIDLLYDWITGELPLRQDYNAWRFDQFGSTNSLEGELTANPDGDFATNWEEFIGGTLPLDPNSYLVSLFSADGSSVSVSFAVPGFRSAYVMTAEEPGGPWKRWDVPGNNGLMRTAGTVTITGSSDQAKQFFRLVMEER